MPKVLNFATGIPHTLTEDTPGSTDRDCESNSEKDVLTATEESSTLRDNTESCEIDSENSESSFSEYRKSHYS